MLDEILKNNLNERLSYAVMEDETYRLLMKNEMSILERLKTIPEEYIQLIDEYAEAHTACSAWENTLAYRKGMLDCAELLRELFLSK